MLAGIFQRRPLVEFWLCLLAGGLLSLVDRTDANWDLQNYHLYAPFALLHGRLALDYFAAGFQAYLNPIADIPYFLAKCVIFPDAPRVVAFCAGLPFGLLAFFLLKLARLLTGGGWIAVLAALIGLTGATTLSEVGTSFGDILVADLILPALFVLLARRGRAPVVAGALAGLAVALKLTAAIYGPPMVLLLVMSTGGWKARLRAVAAFGLAAGVFFILGYAPWAWLLWERFHDPVFPLLGGLFHSPWAPAVNPRDLRFLPKTALQWVAYPFYWIEGRSFVVGEEPIRDPRFALAYVALVTIVASAAGLLPWRQRRPSPALVAFWWFFATSYVIWLILFSILRYALPLEVCTGIVVVSVLRHYFDEHNTRRASLALLVLCLVVTQSVGWGRIGYDKSLLARPLPRLPRHALVFVSGVPLGFAEVPLARPDSRFVDLQLALANAAERQVVLSVLAAGAPVRLLTNRKPAASAGALSQLGLALDACTHMPSAVQQGIELCRLRRAD